jgi:hypothetical protein
LRLLPGRRGTPAWPAVMLCRNWRSALLVMAAGTRSRPWARAVFAAWISARSAAAALPGQAWSRWAWAAASRSRSRCAQHNWWLMPVNVS